MRTDRSMGILLHRKPMRFSFPLQAYQMYHLYNAYTQGGFRLRIPRRALQKPYQMGSGEIQLARQLQLYFLCR